MLFDVLGSLFSLNALLSDQLSHLVSTTVPGIVVWDQYTELLKWALNSLADIFNNGGLAIIAFTIIVKTLLLPITVKSIRSSKNMQELAPKIKEIQKKYGKDRQRASQETMALYQTHGVNPMAGCLPMVLQIPIFFGLYHTISNLSKSGEGVWSGGFLWLQHLDLSDPWKLLPILAALFQFVQARMMRPANQKVTDQQQQIMNTMMNFMPLMVVLFGWNFASGPVLYWVTQAIYSVVQQWLITGWGSFGEWFPWLPELPEHRRLGYQVPGKFEDVVVVSGAAGAVAPQGKGMSAWINRKMMEAQNTTQERQDSARNAKAGSAPGSTKTTAGKNGRNGKATAVNDDIIEAEVDDVVESRSKQRSANYQSRTAGSKFGATRNVSTNGAGNGAGNGAVVVTGAAKGTVATAPNQKAGKTGNPRTKPKRRPTA